MKPTKQIHLELLDALSALIKLRPEWRLGQTVANLATTAGRIDAGGVWELEDDEALSAARTLIAQYSETQSNFDQPAAASNGPCSPDSAPPDKAVAGPR